MEKKITKLSEKTKLSNHLIREIILQHHSLNNYYSKKELKTIPLEFTSKEDLKNYKELQKIAKTLKVDTDAVLVVFLKQYMQMNP